MNGAAIDAARIVAARTVLARHFTSTPLVEAESLAAGRTLWLKNETVLPTGSFKARGAIYAVSVRAARGEVGEVVAASTGNHGAAVAYAARLFGIPARIFLPLGSNPVKAARIRECGATLAVSGIDLSAAIDAAADHAVSTGAYFLHDAHDADIPVGTATIGAEILEQLSPQTPAVVFVPMGDTALIRGVAAALALAPDPVHVVGVVAQTAPAYFLSWNSGRVVETESALTIADGLAVRRPLAANVEAIRQLVNEVVAVSEGEMLDAIALLKAKQGILAEPSGAAALAAWLRDAGRAGSCVALVTGGNISPDVERSLAGR